MRFIFSKHAVPSAYFPAARLWVKRGCHWLTAFFMLVFLSQCAGIYKQRAPEKPLDENTVRKIIADIQKQQKKVFSFYTNGRISASKWYGESEANVLIVGVKAPFKVKIEITHAWGQPIVHILINHMRLEVLSFSDKTLYLGNYTAESLSKFFPGFIEPDLIWSVLRGYPNVQSHYRATSRMPNQVTLFDEKDKAVSVMDIDPDTLLPWLVTFPDKYLSLTFSDYQDKSGIIYAEKVKVDDRKEKKIITLINTDMIFNKTIPSAIFSQTKPPSFGIKYLN